MGAQLIGGGGGGGGGVVKVMNVNDLTSCNLHAPTAQLVPSKA